MRTDSEPDLSAHNFQCSYPFLESKVQVLNFLHPSVDHKYLNMLILHAYVNDCSIAYPNLLGMKRFGCC
jgi:hypothetical protein